MIPERETDRLTEEGTPRITDSTRPYISRSPLMVPVLQTLERAAATDVPVLITGESGVGKDVLARLVHRRSPRTRRPFVKINCAALPASLLESELFGHQRGAFTGAVGDTQGKFELASGGTLFLDEIGEIPPEMQAKLLQVLQDGEYFRVGGSRAVQVDTRVVVATNRLLELDIAQGRFRADLFYRLNVVRVHVPSLRERPEDIVPLANHFLRVYADRYRRGYDMLPDDVADAFALYSWPGNVRELQNIVRRLVVLEDPRGILAELQSTTTPGSPPTSPRRSSVDETSTTPTDPAARALETLGVVRPGAWDQLTLKDVSARAQLVAERAAITHALRLHRWNRKRAAQHLQISYKALLYKMKDCQIVDPRESDTLEWTSPAETMAPPPEPMDGPSRSPGGE